MLAEPLHMLIVDTASASAQRLVAAYNLSPLFPVICHGNVCLTDCVARCPCLCMAVPQGMIKAYRTMGRMLQQQYGAVVSPSSSSSGSGTGSSRRTAVSPNKHAAGRLSVEADATAAGSDAAATAASGAGVDLAADADGANIAALLANPQTNAAAFLVIVVMMVLLWRLAVMQPMLLQAVRGMATAVAQR
jgi:hypothetical protein